MYGYSFGTAAADVWHLTDHTAMLYPSYLPYTAAGQQICYYIDAGARCLHAR